MESRSNNCFLVFLILLCNVLASGEHHRLRHEAGAGLSNNVEHQTEIDSENKLLLECQHSDYRTYIKCLKREKRQHHGGLEKRACLDECFELKCNTSACLRDCHARCKRRLIETYSKTVETYDCADGSCSDSDSHRLANITTNIHINNVLPNGTNCGGNGKGSGSGGSGGPAGPSGPGGPGGSGGPGTGGSPGGSGGPGSGGGQGGSGGLGNGGSQGGQGGQGGHGGQGTGGGGTGEGGDGGSGGGGGGGGGRGGAGGQSGNGTGNGWGISGEPKININNVINNNGPVPPTNSDCPCPATGCNCYPFSPWQAMPQITIGFGPGPVGGCGFPMSWPCLQRYPAPPADCSMCSNPFLRYQCNPVCTPVIDPRRNSTINTTPRSNTTAPNGWRRYQHVK